MFYHFFLCRQPMLTSKEYDERLVCLGLCVWEKHVILHVAEINKTENSDVKTKQDQEVSLCTQDQALLSTKFEDLDNFHTLCIIS